VLYTTRVSVLKGYSTDISADIIFHLSQVLTPINITTGYEPRETLEYEVKSENCVSVRNVWLFTSGGCCALTFEIKRQRRCTRQAHNIDKLCDNNYEVWRMQMKSVLVYNDLWGYVAGTIVKPENAEVVVTWTTKDEKALALIVVGVSKTEIGNIRNQTMSKGA